MKTLTVGEFKAQFSEVLGQLLRDGEPVAISYGRRKEKVAAVVPMGMLVAGGERPLGIMNGKARCTISKGFSVSDEELLGS